MILIERETTSYIEPRFFDGFEGNDTRWNEAPPANTYDTREEAEEVARKVDKVTPFEVNVVE